MNRKSPKSEISLSSLLFSFVRGKSFMKSKSIDKEKVIKKGRLVIIPIIIALVILILIYILHVYIDIKINLLVTYNALVIAAAVFLLNYHIGELRDVTTSYRNKNARKDKAFKFWTENKTQDAGVRIVEVKTFFICLILLGIIFLMLSSLIIIASLNLNLFALWLSSVSSIGIVAVLTITFYIYLKSAVNFAKKNPYRSDA